MKSLAALSLVSSYAVGGDPVDHSLDIHSSSGVATVSAPPELSFSTQQPVGPTYVGWDKFNKLNGDGFKNQVIADNENLWVVAYIHKTCGSCQRLSNEWEGLQKLESIKGRRVKFGYIDMDEDGAKDIIANHTIDGKVPYTPTLFIYGSDKQPVEYTGEYLSGPLDKYICNYCDGHGFGGGQALSDSIDTIKITDEAMVKAKLESPKAPKAPEMGIKEDDQTSLFEGVANLKMLRQQAKSALKGEYDITDNHLFQAKQYSKAPHGVAHGQYGYVPRQSFGAAFGGYQTGQVYGASNYARDASGQDAYSHFGQGSAYGTAPGYGVTYGLNKTTHPAKHALPQYQQQPYRPAAQPYNQHQPFQQTQAYQLKKQPYQQATPFQQGHYQLQAAVKPISYKAQAGGYSQGPVPHHQLEAQPQNLQRQLNQIQKAVQLSHQQTQQKNGGVQNSYGSSYSTPGSFSRTGYQNLGRYGGGKSFGYGNSRGGYGHAAQVTQPYGLRRGAAYGTQGLGAQSISAQVLGAQGHGAQGLDAQGLGAQGLSAQGLYGAQQAYGAQKAYGVQDGYGAQSAYGAQQAYGAQKSYDAQDSYGLGLQQAQKGYGVQDSYGVQNLYGAQNGYGQQNSFGLQVGSQQLGAVKGLGIQTAAQSSYEEPYSQSDSHRSMFSDDSKKDDQFSWGENDRMSVAPSRRGRDGSSRVRQALNQDIFGGLEDEMSSRFGGRSRSSSRQPRSSRHSRRSGISGFSW